MDSVANIPLPNIYKIVFAVVGVLHQQRIQPFNVVKKFHHQIYTNHFAVGVLHQQRIQPSKVVKKFHTFSCLIYNDADEK
jgi:hypothetical protein